MYMLFRVIGAWSNDKNKMLASDWVKSGHIEKYAGYVTNLELGKKHDPLKCIHLAIVVQHTKIDLHHWYFLEAKINILYKA